MTHDNAPSRDEPIPATAGTALVPVSPPGGSRPTAEQRTTRFAIIRPDPSFVTQLIATAAHVPQTCGLRRASPEQAQSSYLAAANKNDTPRSRVTALSRVA
jgi:hypothetical protein